MRISWSCEPRKGYWAISAILKMDSVYPGMQVAAQMHIPFIQVKNETVPGTIFREVIADMTNSIEHRKKHEIHRAVKWKLEQEEKKLSHVIEYQNGYPYRLHKIDNLHKSTQQRSIISFDITQQKIPLTATHRCVLATEAATNTVEILSLPFFHHKDLWAFYKQIGWNNKGKRYIHRGNTE